MYEIIISPYIIFKKIKFIVDIKGVFMYNMSCVRDMTNIKKRQTLCSGVWLSLARALDLGSRGRRFESCHPDYKRV